MSFLDYETLKQIYAERHNEKKAQKARKKEFTEQQMKENAQLQKLIAETQHSLDEQYKSSLQRRKLEQQNIKQKAEQLALQKEQENERETEALRQQSRQAIQKVVFDGITQCRNIFREKYQAVQKLLMACQEFSNAPYNSYLKELIEKFEQLISKIRSNEYGPAELMAAQNLCESIEALEMKIMCELEDFIEKSKVKAEETFRQLAAEEAERKQQAEMDEQRRQEEQLQQQQQQAQIKANELQKAEAEKQQANLEMQNSQPAATATANTTASTQAYDNMTSFETEQINAYKNVLQFYEHIVDKVQSLKNDDALKKYRFACQKAINTPINSIAAATPQHMQDKFEKLYGFINGQASYEVRVTDHPLGRDYCLLLMAKRFVSQGSTTVSSNPQAAFPIASILVSLWKLVPELGQLFLAYLYKDSPYLVPCLLRQQVGQSQEDFLKQLGYHFTNNEIEQSELYLKRQSGLARLYAAVMITNGRMAEGPTHPHGITVAWSWLTKFITLGPLPDLSATILTEFLQTIGLTLYNCYGKQFIKLLVYIQHVYLPQLAAIDKGGPKARLDMQLNKFLKEGRVDKPQGMLEQGFW